MKMDFLQRIRELFARKLTSSLSPAGEQEFVSLVQQGDMNGFLLMSQRGGGFWQRGQHRIGKELKRVAELQQGEKMRRREVWRWRGVTATFLVLAGLAAYFALSYRRAAGTVASPSATTAASAHRYYVDSAGNDAADGSKSRPWKTVDAVNKAVLGKGDSVFFRGGQVFKGTLRVHDVTGQTANPIWVGSYGDAKYAGGQDKGGLYASGQYASGQYASGPATIDGGDSSGVVVWHSRWVVINGLRLLGAGRKTGNVKNGLEIDDCAHIRVEKVDVSGFQKSGVFVYASANVEVDGVFAHENGSAGISVEGPYDRKTGSRDLTIIRCRADDNPGDPTNLTNHSGNGIVCGHCTRLLIDQCSATNNGWDMPRIGNGPVGIWCYEADSVTIQHCLAYRNKTSPGAADGGGFDFDGGVTNSVIQYCLSYGNQGSGYCIFQYWGASPWYNNIIRYNITEDDGLVSDSRAGIYVWNSSNDSNQFHDCQVYNNTVFNTREAALSYSTTSARKGFVFRNNIFVGADSLVRGNRGADVFERNDWWVYHASSGRSSKRGDLGLPGTFVKPDFKDPGGTMVTTVDSLARYEKYLLKPGSVLRGIGANF